MGKQSRKKPKLGDFSEESTYTYSDDELGKKKEVNSTCILKEKTCSTKQLFAERKKWNPAIWSPKYIGQNSLEQEKRG